MINHLRGIVVLLVFLLSGKFAEACHGLALVSYSYSIGATGITINGSSNSATCGCGPYWMQAEVACTAGGVSGNPPAAVQSTLAGWTGPGTTYNSYPWYNSLLNIAGYAGPSWTDQCVVEPYNSIFIPFTGLCPGQTYYFAAREWLSGSNSGGPWTAVTSFTVPGILVPLTAVVTASPSTICSGQCVTLSVTGITGGCGSGTTATWSAGLGAGFTKTVCPTTTTTYFCTVSTGCTSITHSVTVTVVPSVTAPFTSSPNQCLTGNSFTFTHSGTPGVPTHNWNFGDGTTGTGTPVTHSYSAVGTYVVTHTASAGTCTAVATSTVTVYPMPNAPTFNSVNTLCGQSIGSVTVTASGGNPPYSYSLNGGGFQPGNIFSGLAAGTHTITVQTIDGCQSTGTVTITSTSSPTAVALSSTPDGCLAVGSITIGAVTGGTAPYNYSLNPAGPFTATTNYTNLTAGTYTVYVQDQAGCPYNQTVTVGSITPPTDITFSNTQSTCGLANGSLSATVVGGTAAYTYSLNGGAAQGSGAFNALLAGNYTVTATDANGCVVSDTTNVLSANTPTLSLVGTTNVSCNGGADGSATVTASGGATAYTYSLNPGGASNGTGIFTGLTVNAYTATVSDANSCTSTTTFTITQPAVLTNAISATTNISCAGGSNGSITAGAAGGTAPYNYSLNGGATQTTGSFTGLIQGAYTITVTDSAGCQATATATITEPAALSLSFTSTNANCSAADGEAIVTPSGGTAPYTYSWSGGGGTDSTTVGVVTGNYIATVTDAAGCIATGSITVGQTSGGTASIINITNASCNGASDGSMTATVTPTGATSYTYSWSPSGGTLQTATGLPADTFTVVITDNFGCTSTATAIITEPTAILPNLVSTDVSCNGGNDGTVTSTPSGGTAPYTFSWTPNLGTGNSISGPAGNYVCAVTDDNGCVATDTAIINEPLPLSVTSTVTNVNCNGSCNGSVQVNVTGGTGGINYLWSDGQLTSNATNLCPGNYDVIATDGNGCTDTSYYTITEPSALTLDSLVTTSACGLANGNATVIPSGGTPNPVAPFYFYSWNTTPVQSSDVADSLSAGNYICTVTDANGCIATITVVVGNIAGPSLASITQVPATCFGQSNGSATVVLNGGTNPISYVWVNSSNVNQNQNSDTLSNVPAGTYSVNAQDGTGCIVNANITITEPPQLTLQVSPQDTICFGQSSTLSATPGGGTAPYSISWTFGSNSLSGPGPHTVSPALTTTFSVTVIDDNGCSIPGVQTAILVRPPLNSITNDVAGCDESTVQISATAGGGNGGPYTYTWTGLGAGQNKNVVVDISQSPATYVVTISDGCTTPITDSVIVNAYQLPSAIVTPDVVSGCEALDVNFSAGSDVGISFSWNYDDGSAPDTGATTSHTFVNDGVYDITLTVVSAQGCTTVVNNQQMITVYPLPVAEFSWTPTDATALNPLVSFANLSVGGATYYWDFGDWTSDSDVSSESDPSYSYPSSGDYTVFLLTTSPYGCKDSIEHVITVSPDFAIFVPNAFSPDGDELNDVFFPKGVGIDEENYKLLIYDRWGMQIFQTDKWNEGWDGKINGGSEIVEIDVYVWRIIVDDFKGEKHVLTGHVTVVK